MLPFTVRLGPLAITPVEVAITVGVVLAAIVGRRRLASIGVHGWELVDTALAAVLGGAVGAKLFYAVPVWIKGGSSGPWSDGSGFFGGLALGAAGVAIFSKMRGRAPMAVLDAAAPVLPLGFAVGKIGCWMAGCCFGKNGHPTQLYEMAFGLVLFAALIVKPAHAFAKFLLAYSAWRFAIEFLRNDPDRHGFGASLTDSQVAALVVIPVGAVLYFLQSRGAPPSQDHCESNLGSREGEASR